MIIKNTYEVCVLNIQNITLKQQILHKTGMVGKGFGILSWSIL